MIDIATQEILKVVDVGLQNSNLWELRILDPFIDPNLKYKIQSATLPFLGFETETRKTGTKHFTNYTSEDEFTITFLETTNFDVFHFLNDWKELIYDSKKRVFKANGYLHAKDLEIFFQKDETIKFIGPINAHLRHSTQGFHFKRTLFKNVSSWDLNYTSNDPLIITATFICDTITPVNAEFVNLPTRKELVQNIFK